MLIVKIGKQEKEVENDGLEEAIASFVEAKNAIKSWDESVKEARAIIEEEAKSFLKNNEAATVSFLMDEDMGVKITFGWDVKVGDDEKLRTLLGDAFPFLVKTETIYKPEPKLKEMALVDDGLKSCLLIKEKAAAVSVLS